MSAYALPGSFFLPTMSGAASVAPFEPSKTTKGMTSAVTDAKSKLANSFAGTRNDETHAGVTSRYVCRCKFGNESWDSDVDDDDDDDDDDNNNNDGCHSPPLSYYSSQQHHSTSSLKDNHADAADSSPRFVTDFPSCVVVERHGHEHERYDDFVESVNTDGRGADGNGNGSGNDCASKPNLIVAVKSASVDPVGLVMGLARKGTTSGRSSPSRGQDDGGSKRTSSPSSSPSSFSESPSRAGRGVLCRRRRRRLRADAPSPELPSSSSSYSSSDSRGSGIPTSRDTSDDAVRFHLSISFNGRTYSATRTLPRFVRLRRDLMDELAILRTEGVSNRLRRNKRDLNGNGGVGRCMLVSNQEKDEDKVEEVASNEEDDDDKDYVASGYYDRAVVIPELPIGGGLENGIGHDSMHAPTYSTASSGLSGGGGNGGGGNGDGSGGACASISSLSSFAGRGFTRLQALLDRHYCPAMEKWLRTVTTIVPPETSPSLMDFLWEPLGASACVRNGVKVAACDASEVGVMRATNMATQISYVPSSFSIMTDDGGIGSGNGSEKGKDVSAVEDTELVPTSLPASLDKKATSPNERPPKSPTSSCGRLGGGKVRTTRLRSISSRSLFTLDSIEEDVQSEEEEKDNGDDSDNC